MEQAQTVQYYLGANTTGGFYSLYHGFCPPEGEDFLWVIKGGPGCGKSSFMRKIAAAMQADGLAAEYVLCSGDPDSLDGVYFPALHVGFVDGTAPHVQEVACPAASGLYLDLGRFYDRAPLQAQRDAIRTLNLAYKGLYSKAYDLLASCPPPDAGAVHEALPALSPNGSGFPGKIRRRFLRAVSCKGLVSVSAPSYRHVRELSSPAALTLLAEQASAAGYDVVCVQHPLFPALCESVQIAALDTEYFCNFSLYDAKVQPTIREACALLAEAKALHDRLEAVYNPHVDFGGVYALAEAHIEALKEQNSAL